VYPGHLTNRNSRWESAV